MGRRGREGTQVEWRAGGRGREGRGRGGGQAGGREGGRGGWGRGGRRKFYLRAELIKCIDPNEGEALKRGREGGEGRGRGGGRKFYLGVELIKCIDPNKGEALRRGSTFKPGGLVPLPPCSTAYGGGGAGGRDDIGL